jgi:hypothetical protein
MTISASHSILNCEDFLSDDERELDGVVIAPPKTPAYQPLLLAGMDTADLAIFRGS